MSFNIDDEKIAYVSPAETSWKVAIRDGTGLSQGLFTVTSRNYYDTVEDARDAAQRFVEGGKADRMELSVVTQKLIDE